MLQNTMFRIFAHVIVRRPGEAGAYANAVMPSTFDWPAYEALCLRDAFGDLTTRERVKLYRMLTASGLVPDQEAPPPQRVARDRVIAATREQQIMASLDETFEGVSRGQNIWSGLMRSFRLNAELAERQHHRQHPLLRSGQASSSASSGHAMVARYTARIM
jgi:hypothetical protein